MKTFVKILTASSLTLIIASFVAVIFWNAEFHSHPILQVATIANCFCFVGALAALHNVR